MLLSTITVFRYGLGVQARLISTEEIGVSAVGLGLGLECSGIEGFKVQGYRCFGMRISQLRSDLQLTWRFKSTYK